MIDSGYSPVTRSVLCGTLIELDPSLSFDNAFARITLRTTHQTLRHMKAGLVQRGGTVILAPKAEPKPDETEKVIQKPKEKLNQDAHVATIGQMSVQLPALTVARIRNELYVKTDSWVGVTAPLSSAAGLIPSEEVLLLLKVISKKPPVAVQPGSETPDLSPAVSAGMKKTVGPFAEELPLYVAIEKISNQSGVPIMLCPKLDDARVNTSIRFDKQVLSLQAALEQISRAGEVDVTKLTSVLLITPRNSAIKTRLETYPIMDLIEQSTDFPGPMEPAENRSLVRNDGHFTASDICIYLKEKVFAREFESPVTSIEEANGTLVVMQTPEMHGKIQRALQEYRAKVVQPVQICGRWVVVDSSALKETFGMKTPQILTADQAKKMAALLADKSARHVATTRFGLLNGIAHTFSGGSLATISGYDTTDTLPDPVISSVNDGAKLEVRATGSNEHLLELTARLHKILEENTFEPAGKTDGKGVPAASAGMGIVHSNRVKMNDICTSVSVENGGGALFQMPVPEWIIGENTQVAKKGQRVLILFVTARRQQD